jgi:hypothetical protein
MVGHAGINTAHLLSPLSLTVVLHAVSSQRVTAVSQHEARHSGSVITQCRWMAGPARHMPFAASTLTVGIDILADSAPKGLVQLPALAGLYRKCSG